MANLELDDTGHSLKSKLEDHLDGRACLPDFEVDRQLELARVKIANISKDVANRLFGDGQKITNNTYFSTQEAQEQVLKFYSELNREFFREGLSTVPLIGNLSTIVREVGKVYAEHGFYFNTYPTVLPTGQSTVVLAIFEASQKEKLVAPSVVGDLSELGIDTASLDPVSLRTLEKDILFPGNDISSVHREKRAGLASYFREHGSFCAYINKPLAANREVWGDLPTETVLEFLKFNEIGNYIATQIVPFDFEGTLTVRGRGVLQINFFNIGEALSDYVTLKNVGGEIGSLDEVGPLLDKLLRTSLATGLSRYELSEFIALRSIDAVRNPENKFVSKIRRVPGVSETISLVNASKKERALRAKELIVSTNEKYLDVIFSGVFKK